MSKRTYPRLGRERSCRGAHPCVVCGAPATTTVDLQWSYMRGDDDVPDVCTEHRRDLSAIVRAVSQKAEGE